MRKPTIYIFVNKSLEMSPGKLGAQTAHAMAKAMTVHNLNDWWSSPHRTVLVMQARDEMHIRNIGIYLKERGVNVYPIIDEGVNEIDPHVVTAVATDVVDKDLEEVQDIFSTFKTYREKYRIILEHTD